MCCYSCAHKVCLRSFTSLRKMWKWSQSFLFLISSKNLKNKNFHRLTFFWLTNTKHLKLIRNLIVQWNSCIRRFAALLLTKALTIAWFIYLFIGSSRMWTSVGHLLELRSVWKSASESRWDLFLLSKKLWRGFYIQLGQTGTFLTVEVFWWGYKAFSYFIRAWIFAVVAPVMLICRKKTTL